MWGPTIRSYSLLVAFSLLAINEFFHWYQQRDWWSGVRCAGAVLLLLLAHLNGVYTVAFLMLLLAAESVSAGWSGGRKFLWESRTLWIPLAGVAIIVGIAYWRLLPDIAKVNQRMGNRYPANKHGISSAGLYHVHGCWLRAPCCPLLLLLAGCWSACAREASASSAVWSDHSGPDPYVFAGVSVHTSAYARYLISSLPLLLILIAEGIDWLARHVRMRRGAAVAAWGLTALIVLCWTPYRPAQFLVQETMAVCPGGQVSAYAYAEKRCHCCGMGRRIHIGAVLRRCRRSYHAARQLR